MTSKYSLCGCMLDVPPAQIRRFLDHPGVNLLEWRLDIFIRSHSLGPTMDALSILSSDRRHPVVVTNRPTWEGGRFDRSEDLRVEILQKAVEAGADWVDIEGRVGEDCLQWFKDSRAKVLLSYHDFTGTPDVGSLRRMAEKMAQRGADAIKIVTYSHKPEDNLSVLDLIPFVRGELGTEVIAFCMGPLGRWTRLACLLVGSPWTYVQLDEQAPAAPGQLTATQMRTILEMIV